MHPLHAGIVATLYMTTIDDLIADAYAGEIDDLNDSTPECFTRWVDSTYTHLVNWIQNARHWAFFYACFNRTHPTFPSENRTQTTWIHPPKLVRVQIIRVQTV